METKCIRASIRASRLLVLSLPLAAVGLAGTGLACPQDHTATPAPGFKDSQQRGITYLLGQQKEGSIWGKEARGGGMFPSVGLTALALAAVMTKPEALQDEAEKDLAGKLLATVLAAQNADGSFGDNLPNYQTSAAVHALARCDRGRKDIAEAIQRAYGYLVGAQNTEQHGYGPDDPDYGSFGYGPKSRGDMSNTQFAIEALRAASKDGQNDAYTKALVFLQRSQNLRAVNDYHGETTDRNTKETFEVQPGDDGGCGYYPGNSAAGYDTIADGVRTPRSYGSMTYALLKTYLLCGVAKDDPRVQAAVRWIRRNWSVETNPGASPTMGESGKYQGLFYYYETMSKALNVAGVDHLATEGADEASHDWRRELRDHLEKIQREDGSWVNEHNDRWWEGQPALCTIFALLALDQCGSQESAKATGSPSPSTETKKARGDK
ncbi:MAG: prenyltransferase/squalene oxidase repeat-containing protein [Planctomycetota bacterium]